PEVGRLSIHIESMFVKQSGVNLGDFSRFQRVDGSGVRKAFLQTVDKCHLRQFEPLALRDAKAGTASMWRLSFGFSRDRHFCGNHFEPVVMRAMASEDELLAGTTAAPDLPEAVN